MSDSNIIPLDWAVEALCSGGWKIAARFADEAAAWTYGHTHLDARVYRKGLCLGQRSTEVAGGGWHSVERFKRLKIARDLAIAERLEKERNAA